MGLFKKKNPQDAFDPDVFTITDTILGPPRFTFLPAIYQDATHRKWAVQAGEDEISKLEIPVTAGEVKRDSGLYRSYRNVAEQIKEAFDVMGCPEQ